jgi:ATP-dependent DNA helicase RecG
LIQESVSFQNLGLVVVDEQHRFGVAQRQQLIEKGAAPHLIVMTATPIPRSLALTLYGDLDLSIIDEMPSGRAGVRTEVRGPSARRQIWRFVRSEVESGGQAYVVYPLIEASARIEAEALEDQVAILREEFEGLEIGVLHGRLCRKERESIVDRFRQGAIRILLATTVIEVGVDVPEATVMVVESADRFGLSQLHQLRGRVGRGERRSWCILITGEEPSAEAVRRLEIIKETHDGFRVAEADLEHRGPGQLTGYRQWGPEIFRFADLATHQQLAATARQVARSVGSEKQLASLRDRLLNLYPMGREFSIG